MGIRQRPRLARVVPAREGEEAALAELLGYPAGTPPSSVPTSQPGYPLRRFAWHVLDHAWEIEDKSV